MRCCCYYLFFYFIALHPIIIDFSYWGLEVGKEDMGFLLLGEAAVSAEMGG